MNFSSLEYIIFFVIVIVGYYLIPQKGKRIFLLAASYVFYGFFEIENIAVLLCSTMIVYAGGVLLEKCKQKAKFIMLAEVILNVGVLLVFKYANFAVESLNNVAQTLHMPVEMNKFSLILPVGISFYVFSAISYILDVYREKISAEKNFINFALYMSYFPKVTSGPIERFEPFKKQIESKIYFDYEKVKDGFLLLLLGYAQN